MKVSKIVLSCLLGWGMGSMSVWASTSLAADMEAKPVTKSPITATQKPKVKAENKAKTKKGKTPKNTSAGTQNKIHQSSGVKLNMTDQSPNTTAQKPNTTQNSATNQNSTTTQNKLDQSSGVKLNMVDP